MARKKRTTQPKEVQDYRHDTATRKNNPPAGIAAQGKIQETPKQEYAYNPHLPPNLRSDPNGDADKLPELLQIAQAATPHRRRSENPRRCAPTPQSMARMGRQTGNEIFHCGPCCAAYPRAGECQSHLEGRGTPKRPA